MKYTFPSKSWATSHPSGSGISPFRLLGIFHCALNPSKSSLSIAVRSTGAYLCARAHASRAAYTPRSLGQRENRREEGGEEGAKGIETEKRETRERRARSDRWKGGEGGKERAREAAGKRRRRRRNVSRARARTRTPSVTRPGAYMCVCANSFALSLSLSFSDSRSLLRHHEYLIIISEMTSESPPSDSSRAEFHR